MNGRQDQCDLGRRVALRRTELGLTIDQVANRSGMTAGYIDYVEHHPANVSAEALFRLAAALETTEGTLLGEGVDRPAGQGEPGQGPRLEQLTEAECRSLIAPGGVGRVVFSTEHGPEALPVNYVVVDDALIFRTARGSPLATIVGTNIGFEVDRLDEAFKEGWSVLVSGQADHVTEPAMVRRLDSIVSKPWAGGDRDMLIRIEPVRFTGRRIYSHR
jgi:transcriptional regulator with XRE-family HTH domain